MYKEFRNTAYEMIRSHQEFDKVSDNAVELIIDRFIDTRKSHSKNQPSLVSKENFDKHIEDYIDRYLTTKENCLEADYPSVQVADLKWSIRHYINTKTRKNCNPSSIEAFESYERERKQLQAEYEDTLDQIARVFMKSALNNTTLRISSALWERLDSLREILLRDFEIGTYSHFLTPGELDRLKAQWPNILNLQAKRKKQAEENHLMFDESIEQERGLIWSVNRNSRKGPSYNEVSNSVLYFQVDVLYQELSEEMKDKIDQLIEDNLIDNYSLDELMHYLQKQEKKTLHL